MFDHKLKVLQSERTDGKANSSSQIWLGQAKNLFCSSY